MNLGNSIVVLTILLLSPVLITGLCIWLFRMMTGAAEGDGAWAGVYTGNYVCALHDWFIWALLLFYLLFAVSFASFGSVRGIACITVGVAAYWWIMRFGFSMKSYWWVTCYSFPAGLLFSKYEQSVRRAVSKRSIEVSVVLVVVLTTAACLCFARHLPLVERLKEVFVVAVCSVVAVCLLYSDILTKIGILRFLGTISFEIYMVHGLFEYSLSPLGWSPWLYCVTVIMATVVSSCGLHHLDALIVSRFGKWLDEAILVKSGEGAGA